MSYYVSGICMQRVFSIFLMFTLNFESVNINIVFDYMTTITFNFNRLKTKGKSLILLNVTKISSNKSNYRPM